MTVSSTTSRWEYNGDGTTVVFPYDNRIFAATDLKVLVDGAPKGLGTHYTVSGVDSPAGGNITFSAAPAAGVKNVIIVREVPATQNTAYPANDPFPSAAHERALDKLTVLVQQVQALAGRMLRLPGSSTYAGSLDLPPPVGGRGLKWAEDGQSLTNTLFDPDQLAAAAAAAVESAALCSAAEAIASAAASAAQQAVGGARVSPSDTTPGTLSAKIEVSGLAAKAIVNPGADERLSLSVAVATQAEAEAGTADDKAMTPIRTAQAIAALGLGAPGIHRGLKVQVTSGTTLTVSADTLVLTNANGATKTLTAVSLPIAVGTVGVGGLDTPTKSGSYYSNNPAINTWYAVWVIAKADGTAAAMLSLSITAPTLPTGYTYATRVGMVRTAPANITLMATLQRGRRAQYVVGGANLSGLPIISSGTIGTHHTTTPTWAACSVASVVPSTATVLHGVASSVGSGNNCWVYVAPNSSYAGPYSPTNPPVYCATGTTYGVAEFTLALEGTYIYVVSSGPGGIVQAFGWEDNI